MNWSLWIRIYARGDEGDERELTFEGHLGAGLLVLGLLLLVLGVALL